MAIGRRADKKTKDALVMTTWEGPHQLLKPVTEFCIYGFSEAKKYQCALPVSVQYNYFIIFLKVIDIIQQSTCINA
jgi:hypothetical protein